MEPLALYHARSILADTTTLLGRSRARRKEYLQELEAKIRSCEQIGIEASSEIQSAARKVVDENRKLKALLHERGVSETEIIAALGGSSEIAYNQVSCAPSLNAMLERRIACNTIASTSSSTTSHLRAASLPRHMPSVPTVSIPTSRSTALSCTDSPSPGSIVSSIRTPPPVPYSTSFYSTPVTPPNTEIKTEEAHYGFSYEQSFQHNAWQYPNEYHMVAQPPTYYNTPSCVDAANIIRTMRSNMGSGLETDLCCRIPSPNGYINDNTAYNTMDKYSSQQGMI
ncbi:hypothetical protein ACEQ8H_008816 [Pleosporales sp. CAS-2024a]